MSTVAEVARVMRMEVGQVLGLCEQAGLAKQGSEDQLSEADKQALLRIMRRGGASGARLVRSQSSPRQVEIPRTGSPGRNRVRVRVKGRYRKVVEPPPPAAGEPPKPAAEPAPEPAEAQAPEPAAPEPAAPEPAAAQNAPAEEKARPAAETAARPAAPRRHKPARAKPAESPRSKPAERERRRGRLRIDESRRTRRPRSRKRGKVVVEQPSRHEFTAPTERVVREVPIGESVTVAELAKAMAVRATEVIRTLLELGEAATINDRLNHDTAELVVETMGHKPQRIQEADVEADLLADARPSGEPEPRAPVVAVMGHVDHGKTSLLDHLRQTRVAAGEAGGITQHIGAYRVDTEHGRITFLDTPGHAAFTSMRGRGAHCTDLVVLVVAADDGVMPQTEEAVRHARAAEVPVIVAINKIDRENADPEKVRTGLAALDLRPEDWGGDTLFVPVSAKTGEGVAALLEAISLQAELLDLRAPASGMANGVVIESSLDRGRGPTATVLVQAGCLRPRDLLLCGQEYGRVRAMFDEHGQPVKAAGPSTPVLVLGLSGVPEASDPAHVLADEQKACEVAEYRKERTRRLQSAEPRAADPAAWVTRMGAEQKSTLNLIVKADVRGSAEALRELLEGLGTDEIGVKVVLCGIGGINESDALLADASKSLLLGFNVRADGPARATIADRALDLRYYNVIYELADDVRTMLEARLAPEIREEVLGVAEVLEVFRSSKVGAVAGCRVVEGTVYRGRPIRVLREQVVVFEGALESLRRHKDDVGEVATGTECGIAVADYDDVQVGDQIEVYQRVETARTL